ncbi:hypothetical protein [Bacillus sinesaloumensis]|uniref:hypothetical protein n=1 Tax=Litchfieldia sinesaloumensis TaxID=1926280 RepID=UPI0009883251|nr:hypothetical protein [Bacillus sinesaloumensis]
MKFLQLSERKGKLTLLLILLGCCVLVVYLFYFKTYSTKGILDNVTERDGYTLKLIKNNETVDFYIKPEWIPFASNEEKKLGIALASKNNTTIILDEVWNRGSDIHFNFDTIYDMKYDAGTFLYNGIFNEDGTFTTNGSYHDFDLYNKKAEQIDVGQTGYGPNSSFGFVIDSENYHLIRDGFFVEFSGFYMYEYNRN